MFNRVALMGGKAMPNNCYEIAAPNSAEHYTTTADNSA